jgi:hypothetical protein
VHHTCSICTRTSGPRADSLNIVAAASLRTATNEPTMLLSLPLVEDVCSVLQQVKRPLDEVTVRLAIAAVD